MRCMRAALTFAAVALAGTGAFAEETAGWRLVFSKLTTREKIEHPGVEAKEGSEVAPPKPQESRSDMIVRLAPTWLSIEDGTHEAIYDFDARRLFSVDRVAGSLSEVSLFADIGFREHEMKNRVYLANLLEKAASAAKKKKAPDLGSVMEILDAECAFGIEATPPADPELEETAVEGVLEFRLRGRPTARYRAAEGQLPATLRPALRRFLVYGAHLHPRILAKVESAAVPPALLEYRVRELNDRTTIRLDLTSSAPDTVDWRARLTGLRREPSPAGDVPFRILDEKLQAAPTVEDYQGAADKALVEKNYLDALLALFECNIARGQTDTARVRKVIAAGEKDARVATLLDGLDENDPKEAQRLLDSIDATHLRHGHVLDVFRANARAGAGDAGGAIDLFRKAIAANPYLAGAYKDLGGIFHGQYETPAAWDCWDAGRRIAPDHPMLADIDKLEQHLVRTYPAFF